MDARGTLTMTDHKRVYELTLELQTKVAALSGKTMYADEARKLADTILESLLEAEEQQ